MRKWEGSAINKLCPAFTIIKITPTQEHIMNSGTRHSFKQERTFKIFKQALADGLKLPLREHPKGASTISHPNYCPYHREVGHPIEHCWVFKDLIERKIKDDRLMNE